MAALLSIWANCEFKKNVTAVDFVYDNKGIFMISVMTLIVSLFAIMIYDYTVIRYMMAFLMLCFVIIYGLYYLKRVRQEKGGSKLEKN